MRNYYSLDLGRACVRWCSHLASGQKVVLGLVICQGSKGIVVRYFSSKTIVTLVPGNS